MATLATSRVVKAPNPYVGPPPFRREDRERFFGRDREKSELYSLVAAHRTVLLYAQSGAGKTSLLNAKLIPELGEGGFDVLTTSRFSQLGADVALATGSRSTSAQSLEARNPLVSVFQHALAGHPRIVGSNRQSIPRVLVFDQFEEFFTSRPELWEQRRGFFEQLNEAMEAEPSLRALFAMREDFVANIDPYEDLLPEEFRTRYRLERLRPEAALEAIEKPLEKTGIRFAPGVAQHLVSNLLKTPTASQASRDYVIEEFVEPVQLQVVCFSLYRKLAEQTTVITDQDLATFGDVDEALREFYNDSLIETVSKTEVAEDTLRQWFEQKLITEAGTRGLVFRGETLTEGLPNSAVDALDKTHIIREEVRGHSRWYELSHDRFIRPVLRANDAWRARVRAAEREKREKESERLQKEAKRFQTLARGLGVSLIVALLAVAFAGNQWMKSHKNYLAKERAEQEAQRNLEIARSSETALRARDDALKVSLAEVVASKKIADESARKANVALKEKELARASANESARKARIAATLAASKADESKKYAEAADLAKNESERLKTEAQQQSRISASRALAASSLNQRTENPQLALWLALYSVSATASDTKDGKATVSEQSLQALLASMPSSMRRWVDLVHCAHGETGSTSVVAVTRKIASLSALAITGTLPPTSLGAVAFTPNGKRLVALDRNGVAYAWDTSNGAEASVGSCDVIHPVAEALSSHGSLLAVTRLRGQTENDSPTPTLGRRSEIAVSPVSPSTTTPVILASHWYQPEALAFNADGTLLGVAAGLSRRSVYELANQNELWNGFSQRLGRLWGRIIADTMGRPPRVATSIGFSPDSKFLAVGAADGTLELWDVQKGQPTRAAFRAHSEALLALAFSPDNRFLATASRDRTALIWDVKSPKAAKVRTSLVGHKDGVISVAFDPSGTIVATGSQDQTVAIWDANSGQVLISLPAEGGYVTGVAFSSDGTMLASVNSDGSMRVWNTGDLNQVRDLETRIQSLQHEAQFKNGTGSVSVAELVGLLKLGEVRATRRLTLNECGKYFGGRGCPPNPSASYE